MLAFAKLACTPSIMEINTPMDFRKALLKFAFQELTEPVRSPAFEYLKTKNSGGHKTIMSAIVANMGSRKIPSEKRQTVVVGLKDEQSSLKQMTPGTDYEQFLTIDEEDFKAIFQISRSTVLKIVRLIEKRIAIMTIDNSDIKFVPIKKRVHLTVWMIANRETIKTTASIFGVMENEVTKIFLHTCKEISLFSNKYIHWPSGADRSYIAKSFKKTYGFPGVVGIIGSGSLDITLPIVRTEEEFWNLQMDTHRIIVQIVVDDRMLIRDAFVDDTQGANSVNAFLTSPIHSRILNNSAEQIFSVNEHLLGNPVFPQLTNLLTPYTHETNDRPITDEEEEYNEIHSRTCSVVEQMLKTLKSRFELLNLLEIGTVQLASKVAYSLCVLHNITLLYDDIT